MAAAGRQVRDDDDHDRVGAHLPVDLGRRRGDERGILLLCL